MNLQDLRPIWSGRPAEGCRLMLGHVCAAAAGIAGGKRVRYGSPRSSVTFRD